MNDLQNFTNGEFGTIRTITDGEIIWFCGSDIAKALGYADTAQAIRKNCKTDGLSTRQVIDSMGRTQQAKFINEPNLYRLICNSKLPSAERFEKWVFEEVLPAIHKTGTYSIAPYPAKATSVSEVVKLLYVVRAAMKDQRSNPRDVARTIKEVCDQFSIHLPDYFIKPETAPKTIREVTDMMDFTFTRPDPTYEGYLTFCPRPKE